jgi:hypothetical protein
MENSDTNQAPQLSEDAVSDSSGYVPFTHNTKKVRMFLEKQGFKPLSFFQGKEYVYPIISTRANANATWKEKDYSTFSENDKERMPFLMKDIFDSEQFEISIEKLT